MLDSMRQNVKKSLQFFIWLVIAAFVGSAFLLWGGSGRGGAGSQDAIAWVNDEPISYAMFENTYRNTYSWYRQLYGDNLTPEMLQTLQLEQRTLNQIAQRMLLTEQARQYNLGVSDEELIQKIHGMPQFQTDGQFDPDLYTDRLSGWRLTPEDFEEQVIQSLLIDKLEYLIKQGVRVSEQEVFEDYKITNETLTVEGWKVTSEAFEEEVEVSEEEIGAYYDEHKEAFTTPERIKIQYIVFDPQALKEEVTPTEEEIREYYENNESEFNKGKEVKASHILFRVKPEAEEEDVAAVKARAEEVLQQIQEGADFAEMAREHSEDTASGENGGDLGYFTKGQMVPKFEEAAFAMEEGEISELVKTQYGYHIIKVEDIREDEDPFATAKPDIIERLKLIDARYIAEERADDAFSTLLDERDLQKIATDAQIEVHVSDFFGRSEPIDDQVGMAPEIQQVAFTLNDAERFSQPIETQSGYYIVEFLERKEPYIPELAEIQDNVETAVRQEKADQAAQEKAQQIADALAEGTAWEDIGEAFAAEQFSPRPFNRRQQYLSETRDKTEAFVKTAFALEEEAYSNVLELPKGYCIIKVVERSSVDEEQFQQEKEALTEQYLTQKQNTVFRDFTEALRQEAEITTSDVLQL